MTEDQRGRLADLETILRSQSAFDGDTPSWAADAIAAFLSGAPSLDHAFGLRSGKRGPKPLSRGAGKHSEWVPKVWMEAYELQRLRPDLDEQTILAAFGRENQVGGEGASDSAIAGEMRKKFDSYRLEIVEHWSQRLTALLPDPSTYITGTALHDKGGISKK
jgi:hypothetical protein